MNHSDEAFFWQPVPLCFACGRELGTGPEDVIYMGWGHREGSEGPAWVATLCPCQEPGSCVDLPSPCVETAREYAASEGMLLSPHQYLDWLKTA